MGITLTQIVDVMMCWPIRALATTLNHNFWAIPQTQDQLCYQGVVRLLRMY